MTQRIHNLSKWLPMPEGSSILFGNKRRRTVVLEVNAPGRVEFYVRQSIENVEGNPERVEDREARREQPRLARWEADQGPAVKNGSCIFLATCHAGRDTIEFAVDGAFELFCVGSPCYVFSTDGQQHFNVVADPEIYTRIANRRQRNPQLEMMMYTMKRNQELFQIQLMEDNERRLRAIEAGAERYKPNRDQRAPAERSLEAITAARQAVAARLSGAEVGAETAAGAEGGSGSGDNEGEPVPSSAPKSRGKAKTPS